MKYLLMILKVTSVFFAKAKNHNDFACLSTDMHGSDILSTVIQYVGSVLKFR